MASSPNSGYSKSILSAIKDLEWKGQEDKKHVAGFTVNALLAPGNMSIVPLLDTSEESSKNADFPAPSINDFQEHKQRVQRSRRSASYDQHKSNSSIVERSKTMKAHSLNQVDLSHLLACETKISVGSSSQSLDNTSNNERSMRASSGLSSDFSKLLRRSRYWCAHSDSRIYVTEIETSSLV